MPTAKHKMGITDTVVNFASKTKFDDLPEEVAHESKRLLLDDVGCALAGLMVDKGRLAVKFARKLGGPPESTIIGTGEKVSSVNAAFANGELINALDFDSTSIPPAHTTPFVYPAVLALAESEGASGKDLILAAVLGHEISYRIGKAISRGLTYNTLGAAIGAAKILKLDREKLSHTLGIAGYLTPVPVSESWSVKSHCQMFKYGSTGWVSHAAVSSALLAEMGHVGDTTVLDGESGFYSFYGAEKWKPEELIDGLGKTWRYINPNFKVYSCGGVVHIHLELLSNIIEENDIRPEDIKEIKLQVNPRLTERPLFMNREIKTHVDAQFSIAYVVSAVAHRLIPGVAWQDLSAIRNPAILKFINKVKINAHPDYDRLLAGAPVAPGERTASSGPGYPAVVEVSAKGKVFKKEGLFAKGRGFPESCRLTDAELVNKFRSNASRILSEDRIEELAKSILELEQIKDVSQLMRLTGM